MAGTGVGRGRIVNPSTTGKRLSLVSGASVGIGQTSSSGSTMTRSPASLPLSAVDLMALSLSIVRPGGVPRGVIEEVPSDLEVTRNPIRDVVPDGVWNVAISVAAVEKVGEEVVEVMVVVSLAMVRLQ